MRKIAEFVVYVLGVVLYSWNYHKLRGAIDILTFLVFSGFYLFGVARFAMLLSHSISRNDEEPR